MSNSAVVNSQGSQKILNLQYFQVALFLIMFKSFVVVFCLFVVVVLLLFFLTTKTFAVRRTNQM